MKMMNKVKEAFRTMSLIPVVINGQYLDMNRVVKDFYDYIDLK